MIESGLLFGLPLLTKDLIEQSARRRTYVLRVVYAVVLYGAALWIYADVAGGGAKAGVSNLGRGRDMFDMLLQVQLFAIILLLPAISCGAVTSEKERDTLGLLLLTKLHPTTIILEKLISRLVTMGTYQLLSLPLFAVVYGLGGVELFEIFAGVWYLICWSAVVCSWSIYCSTWHRTTAGAFIAAYSLMPLVICFSESCLNVTTPAIAEIWRQRGPLTQFQYWMSLAGSMLLLLIMSVPMLGLTWMGVLAAQMCLLDRAFVPSRNLLLEFFKALDGYFEKLNQQTTGGVVLVKEYDVGPMFDPIAWRETRKKSLGTVRYLFRLLVVLEVPLVIAISWTVTDMQATSFDGPTSFFLAVLWPIAALAITVHATSVMAAERSRQTLDVLLVAPLEPGELVSQKLAGVRRLIGILSVPFATLIIFQVVWKLYVVRGLNLFHHGSAEGVVFIHEVLGMILAAIVYPRVVQWIAFSMGLHLKNQTQAVLGTLALVVAICGLPFLATYLLAIGMGVAPINPSIEWLTWLSPVRVLFHRPFSELSLAKDSGLNDSMYIGLGLHAVSFVTLWLLLRRSTLRAFPTAVGRTEPLKGAR